MNRSRLLLAGIVVAWILVIGAGQFLLLRYQSNPGPLATASAWPADSALHPGIGKFTLVLFVHPRCPCTRASLEELSWLLTRFGTKLVVHAVFVLPKGAPADWERTPMWENAASITGSTPVCDLGGHEAERFGVVTSGQTLLFDPQRELVFNGGITSGRGHIGDHPARQALVECLMERDSESRVFPVFGCPLFGDNRVSRNGDQACKP